jgi:hypothetical protein
MRMHTYSYRYDSVKLHAAQAVLNPLNDQRNSPAHPNTHGAQCVAATLPPFMRCNWLVIGAHLMSPAVARTQWRRCWG